MGAFESLYWLSDSWNSRSGTYSAFVPDLLSTLDYRPSQEVAGDVSRAEAAIGKLNGRGGPLTDTEPLARLLLRSEAVGSSRIEGLEVPARKLLEVELLEREGRPIRLDSTEATVIANIEAMRRGIESGGTSPVSVEGICEMNRSLLENTRMAALSGMIRTEQNWIGGDGYSPLNAVYVPPVPERVPGLMEDLVTFVNGSRLPTLAVAAIAHAQFENIHPFADGNGRTGRTLIHVILKRGGLADRIVPPISLVLATDRKGYLEHLAAFRVLGEDPSMIESAIDQWVSYFAGSARVACERAGAFERRLADIERAWRDGCRVRAGSAEDLLLRALIGSPVVSVGSAAELIGRSYQATRLAVSSLADRGVLVQNSKNRRSRIFVAHDVIDAFTGFERALSVPGGDTGIERPKRPVPPRAGSRSLEEIAAAAVEAHGGDGARAHGLPTAGDGRDGKVL